MYKIDYRYLRPKKAAALKKWYDTPLPDRNLQVWQGENAAILPLRPTSDLLFGMGGVVDQDGVYVEQSSIPHRVQGAYSFEKPEYKDETVVYCGYLVHQWGHFLVEGVARLWYFLENDPAIDKYVFMLDENEDREIRGNYRVFLELLGIWDKLEFINRPTSYRKVLVPELAFHCMDYCSAKFLKIFDTVAENAPVDPAWNPIPKIYYSRSQLQKGSGCEFGYDVLDDFFARNGYTILFPEKVPLAQMIFYIRHAEVVATLSGSLPHNMLFAKNGQRVEIIERCVLNNDFQTNVNRMRQLDAVYIDANIPIYTVDMCGPFVMGYTEQLAQFAQDQGYSAPDDKFCSKAYLRKCFKGYMNAYEDFYGYQWFMCDWYAYYTDYLWEGYQAGQTYFGDYLGKKIPFRWYHYFEFHYWKQFIKRILKR